VATQESHRNSGRLDRHPCSIHHGWGQLPCAQHLRYQQWHVDEAREIAWMDTAGRRCGEEVWTLFREASPLVPDWEAVRQVSTCRRQGKARGQPMECQKTEPREEAHTHRSAPGPAHSGEPSLLGDGHVVRSASREMNGAAQSLLVPGRSAPIRKRDEKSQSHAAFTRLCVN
jgi:hypothetical protein